MGSIVLTGMYVEHACVAAKLHSSVGRTLNRNIEHPGVAARIYSIQLESQLTGMCNTLAQQHKGNMQLEA